MKRCNGRPIGSLLAGPAVPAVGGDGPVQRYVVHGARALPSGNRYLAYQSRRRTSMPLPSSALAKALVSWPR